MFFGNFDHFLNISEHLPCAVWNRFRRLPKPNYRRCFDYLQVNPTSRNTDLDVMIDLQVNSTTQTRHTKENQPSGSICI